MLLLVYFLLELLVFFPNELFFFLEAFFELYLFERETIAFGLLLLRLLSGNVAVLQEGPH